jgi:hypothetical protein
MEYVRRHYGVPATRGGIVHFAGQRGTILSATYQLRVRFDDGTKAWLHPTWEVRYQECHEAVSDNDGHLEPCNRPAVGYRYDPEFVGEGPYPVCRRHRREPLTEAAAREIAEAIA